MIVGLPDSNLGGTDLMFSHLQLTGYGGFRKEPSKAPRQCAPCESSGIDLRGGIPDSASYRADRGLGLVVGRTYVNCRNYRDNEQAKIAVCA